VQTQGVQYGQLCMYSRLSSLVTKSILHYYHLTTHFIPHTIR